MTASASASAPSPDSRCPCRGTTSEPGWNIGCCWPCAESNGQMHHPDCPSKPHDTEGTTR